MLFCRPLRQSSSLHASQPAPGSELNHRAPQARYDKCRAKFGAVCVGPALARNEGGRRPGGMLARWAQPLLPLLLPRRCTQHCSSNQMRPAALRPDQT